MVLKWLDWTRLGCMQGQNLITCIISFTHIFKIFISLMQLDLSFYFSVHFSLCLDFLIDRLVLFFFALILSCVKLYFFTCDYFYYWCKTSLMYIFFSLFLLQPIGSQYHILVYMYCNLIFYQVPEICKVIRSWVSGKQFIFRTIPSLVSTSLLQYLHFPSHSQVCLLDKALVIFKFDCSNLDFMHSVLLILGFMSINVAHFYIVNVSRNPVLFLIIPCPPLLTTPPPHLPLDSFYSKIHTSKESLQLWCQCQIIRN